MVVVGATICFLGITIKFHGRTNSAIQPFAFAS